MPHKPDCQCPVCRGRRGDVKGDSPRMTVRLAPDVLSWIRSRAEGARAYLEGLVRRDMGKGAGQEPKEG
jgi:hypothetical protein